MNKNKTTADDVAMDIMDSIDWASVEMAEITDDDEALFSITVDGELWDVTVKRVSV